MFFIAMSEIAFIFAAELQLKLTGTMDTSITQQKQALVAKMYEMYLPELKLYFVNFTHNMMEAEDMVQNLFVKVMRLDLICESTARNLLFVTAHRMIIDSLRHQAHVRQAQRVLRDGSEISDAFSVFDEMERKQILELETRYLQEMPKKRAQIYRMWRDEKTMKEIADEMHITVRTAETHVYLATREMKKYIRQVI